MRFLILSKPRAGAPPHQDREATLQAAREALEGWLASGQLDCVYQRLGGGGVSIANADTAEELLQALWSYPLYPQFEWHVEPLVDAIKAFELS